MIKSNDILFLLLIVFLSSCGVRKDVYEARKAAMNTSNNVETNNNKSTKKIETPKEPTKPKRNYRLEYEQKKPIFFINLLDRSRDSFLVIANSYIGVPYRYGGMNDSGMDCSGFVHRVFSDLGIRSPRVSSDYYPEGKTIDIKKARPGDIILFTGSDHESGRVGHMGIIVDVRPEIKFIHSASGGRKGVIISTLKGYWERHFVKVISVFK